MCVYEDLFNSLTIQSHLICYLPLTYYLRMGRCILNCSLFRRIDAYVYDNY